MVEVDYYKDVHNLFKNVILHLFVMIKNKLVSEMDAVYVVYISVFLKKDNNVQDDDKGSINEDDMGTILQISL